jgi:hypothetical protein
MADLRTVETYPHLTDWAAFVDKATVEVWGTRRKREKKRTVEKCNLAIGGPGRFYGRCSRRRSKPSGNDLQIVYGVTKLFKNLSPYKVTVWAGKRPVLCSDVLLVLDSVMRRGYRARVSSVELAFDVQGDLLRQFTWELCTRARVRDLQGTLYVGGVRSPWQAKLYKRTDSVARVEFTLRSVFLRRHRISAVCELYLLRKVHLWDLVSFCEVDHSLENDLQPRVRAAMAKLERGLAPPFPPCITLRVLRGYRVDPGRWVVRSPRERLLRLMLRNLIF